MIRFGFASIVLVLAVYLLLWLYVTPFVMDGNPLLFAFPFSRLVAIYLILGVFFIFTSAILIYCFFIIYVKGDSNYVRSKPSKLPHSKLKRN